MSYEENTSADLRQLFPDSISTTRIPPTTVSIWTCVTGRRHLVIAAPLADVASSSPPDALPLQAPPE
jgi:hypothetical protein